MILGVLVKNEATKALKRFAFWATLAASAFIVVITYGSSYYRSTHAPIMPWGFPGAWHDVLGNAMAIPAFFAAILLLLLVTGEFEWRTARQNVIDGLSKEEWFTAKALLVPLLTALFVGAHLSIGGGFALAATDFSKVTGPWMTQADVIALGGGALTCLGYSSLALFVGLAVRTPGSAMAIWLLYVAVLERLIAGALGQWSDTLRPIVKWFPVNVFTDLLTPAQHSPEAIQRVMQRAEQMHITPLPVIWPYSQLVLVAVGWIVVLVGGSLLWFRQRDL